MIVLRIVGLGNGQPSEYQDKYVVDYDPTPREDPLGAYVHLEVTASREEARQFPTLADAIAYFRMASKAGPRPDGLPDRPLTAFTVEFA
jgi:hypothetical protein